MCAEINTGKDRFATFENQYRIDVKKKKRLIEKSILFAQPLLLILFTQRQVISVST